MPVRGWSSRSRRGYGSALRAGFAAARGDIVVMADADFTYDLGKIPDLVAPVVRDEADLVIGGRLDAATRRTMPLLHRFVGTPVLTFLVARACGRRVVDDSQSGFRAFRRDRIAELELRSTGMELASEMLIRAARAGLRVTEVPAGYRERIGMSKLSTFSDGWRHLQLILALAPDLLLVGPGAVALGVGIGLAFLGFVSPSGVDVGSLHWQPVFFSGIAIVLGLQALLAGAVLAYRSSLVRGSVHRAVRVRRPARVPGRMPRRRAGRAARRPRTRRRAVRGLGAGRSVAAGARPRGGVPRPEPHHRGDDAGQLRDREPLPPHRRTGFVDSAIHEPKRLTRHPSVSSCQRSWLDSLPTVLRHSRADRKNSVTVSSSPAPSWDATRRLPVERGRVVADDDGEHGVGVVAGEVVGGVELAGRDQPGTHDKVDAVALERGHHRGWVRVGEPGSALNEHGAVELGVA